MASGSLLFVVNCGHLAAPSFMVTNRNDLVTTNDDEAHMREV
jgi:hypothetical protein